MDVLQSSLDCKEKEDTAFKRSGETSEDLTDGPHKLGVRLPGLYGNKAGQPLDGIKN